MKIHSSVKQLVAFMLMMYLAAGCTIHDAPAPKHPYVTVYQDVDGQYDKMIYRKFERETGIKVRVRHLKNSEFLSVLRSEKFNSDADLVLMDNYTTLNEAAISHMLRPVKSEKLEANIDPNYRSRANYWFALSKSPLVIIYNQKVLNKDTIQNYYDLISPRWTGKIALQERDNSTRNSLSRTIRVIMKNKAYHFLWQLEKQTVLPQAGDDALQIKRIETGQAQLALVKLSELARAQYPENTDKKLFPNVAVKFPNQRKKGCYISVTGGGVYRYAKNPRQAQRLLEYLGSRRAQYNYAAGRMQFPVLEDVDNREVLDGYGKFRGRFYRKRISKSKS